MSRSSPSWKWFYSIVSGISVFSLGNPVIKLLKYAILKNPPKIINGPSRKIISYSNLFNAINIERLQLGESLIRFIENDNTEISVVPIEDRFFIIGDCHLVSVEDDCSMRSVNQERDAIKKRQQLKNEILFPPSIFIWKEKIQPGRFEQLIKELLQVESSVLHIRQVGDTNERDRGRDLVADMILVANGTYPSEPEYPPYLRGNVLIQCKSYNKNVGKGQVQDIRDNVDRHGAVGYLLAVSSNITSDLFDYLSNLRNRGEFWVDWWTRQEIEDKLRKNLDIAVRYPDLVEIKRLT